jgi:hypothetical protein
LVIATWGADDESVHRAVLDICGWAELEGFGALVALIRAAAEEQDDVKFRAACAAIIEASISDSAVVLVEDVMSFVDRFGDVRSLESIAEDPVDTAVVLSQIASSAIQVAAGTRRADAVDVLADLLLELDVDPVGFPELGDVSLDLPTVSQAAVTALQRVVEAVIISPEPDRWQDAFNGVGGADRDEVIRALYVSEQVLLGAMLTTGEMTRDEVAQLPEAVRANTPLARYFADVSAFEWYIDALLTDTPTDRALPELSPNQLFFLAVATLTGTAVILAAADPQNAVRLASNTLGLIAEGGQQ